MIFDPNSANVLPEKRKFNPIAVEKFELSSGRF